MRKKEKGITLIALVITIIVLMIIAGISIASITNKNGIIKETEKANSQAQRESILEKIEADLYTEKVKKGRNLKKSEVEAIIGNFGEINQAMKKVTTNEGEYEIDFNEIIGWQQAEED